MREEALRENSFWLNQIRIAARRGESFDQIATFDELLESLTLEEVAAAAERYLTDDRYVRVVLFPGGRIALDITYRPARPA